MSFKFGFRSSKSFTYCTRASLALSLISGFWKSSLLPLHHILIEQLFAVLRLLDVVAVVLYLSVSSFLLCVVLLQSFTEDFLIGLLYILIDRVMFSELLETSMLSGIGLPIFSYSRLLWSWLPLPCGIDTRPIRTPPFNAIHYTEFCYFCQK